MAFIVSLAFLLLLARISFAENQGRGLIGLGQTLYDPLCAFACHDAIAYSPLKCSSHDAGEGHHSSATSNECYASDDAYLTTAAYCMHQYCEGIEIWKIEEFWRKSLVSLMVNPVPPPPKWTYQEALVQIPLPPNETLVVGEPLNKTMLISETDYISNVNGDRGWEVNEMAHARSATAIVILSLTLPIAITIAATFLPLPKRTLSRFYGALIYPSLFLRRHRVPFPGSLGIVPTLGQTIMISMLVFANLLACCLGYQSFQPNNSFFPNGRKWEIVGYIANRTGDVALGNLVVLIVMAGRNNILLYLTSWTHSTYLLLHRWVAYLCVLEVVVHSLVWLANATLNDRDHGEVARETYWIWGIVGTLSFCLLVPLSILPIRQRMYELFLAMHIVLSVVAILGTWYHIWFCYTKDWGSWGYEIWIYLAIAFWSLDRVVRVLQIAKNGIRHAQISVIDDAYIQIHVEGIHAEGHVYLYFPTLTWRFWESHPFSVYASALEAQAKNRDFSVSEEQAAENDSGNSDIEKLPSTKDIRVRSINQKNFEAGFSLLVRTMTGTTRHLRQHVSLPVLVEGSYRTHAALPLHVQFVAIAGGVGITALLPLLKVHQGSKKLYWGSKSQPLVDRMEGHLVGIDARITVGKRLDLESIIEMETDGAGPDIMIAVSGPPSMADDARLFVSRAARRGIRNIRMIEESFSW